MDTTTAGATSHEPACIHALERSHAKIAAHELDAAKRELSAARSLCGPGHGIAWRLGWIEREQGNWDLAALAFLAELRDATPMAATGAQLLDTLEHASPNVRRKASRVGRRRAPIRGGFDGVDDERLLSLICGGKPRGYMVSCDRDTMTCTYRYECRNGAHRYVIEGSAPLWFSESEGGGATTG